MPIVCPYLFKMYPPFRCRCPYHPLAIFPINPEARRPSDIGLQRIQFIIRIALTKIHRKHPSACATPERGVLRVMIKQHQIAGGCLKDRRWDILSMQFPEILAFSSLLRERIRIVITEEMTPWNDAKCASVTSQRVKVKRNLMCIGSSNLCPPSECQPVLPT